MADNYVENHYNDYLKQKERREAARRHRQHQYLEAYRKRLAQQKKEEEKQTNDGIKSSCVSSRNIGVLLCASAPTLKTGVALWCGGSRE